MDYTYKAASLAAISAALTAAGDISPDNMLGSMSVNDAAGSLLYRYGVGRSAMTVTGMDGSPVTIPAIGEDGMFYIAVRVAIDPAYSLTPTTPEESAAVLGVWS